MDKATDDPKAYRRLMREKAPSKPLLRNLVLAFLVGGAIMALSQFVLNYFVATGLTVQEAATPTAAVMIAAGALLTGLGLYDQIGKVGGMGAALPITGFANAMVSPAMEFKREGFVFGVGSRMFSIAGPVIIYGVLTSVAVAWIMLLTGSI